MALPMSFALCKLRSKLSVSPHFTWQPCTTYRGNYNGLYRQRHNYPCSSCFGHPWIRGSIHIVQEYIDAPVLADVWTQLGLDEQKRCMCRLQAYLGQLRALTPPRPGRVQAVDGAGCLDDRLHPGECGPFDSIDAFNPFFHHDLVRHRPEDYPDAQDSLANAPRPNMAHRIHSWRSRSSQSLERWTNCRDY